MNKQDDKYTQSRHEELQPAEGTFTGSVYLKEQDQAFDCVIEVQRTSEFVRIGQSQDQTETIEVPKLAGSMRFPVLDNLEQSDLTSYFSLISPMGGYLRVVFNSGNYNPRTNKMILPYFVSGGSSQESFGQLSGTLKNKRFQGVWFSKPFGNVAKFDLRLLKNS